MHRDGQLRDSDNPSLAWCNHLLNYQPDIISAEQAHFKPVIVQSTLASLSPWSWNCVAPVDQTQPKIRPAFENCTAPRLTAQTLRRREASPVPPDQCQVQPKSHLYVRPGEVAAFAAVVVCRSASQGIQSSGLSPQSDGLSP
jgi:hypothetical protein